MIQRLLSLFASLALALPLAAWAATPDWQKYSWDVPLEFGEYIAVPGGDSVNLGSLAIGVTPDSRNTLGGAIYHYGNDGRMIVQGINGTLTRRGDETLSADGIIARGALTSYDLSGGPCRTCPPGSATATPTQEQIHWEWTGPRAGTLTIDGVTQKMVHAFSGPPLVQAADYSGDWLMLARLDDDDGSGRVHYEGVYRVRLVLVQGARSYSVVDNPWPGHQPWPYNLLPTPGSRLYDVVCLERSCPFISFTTAYYPPTGAVREYTIWLDEGGSGRLLAVDESGGQRTVVNSGVEHARVYATPQFMVARRDLREAAVVAHTTVFSEFSLQRIAPQTVNGDYHKPPCGPEAPPYPACGWWGG